MNTSNDQNCYQTCHKIKHFDSMSSYKMFCFLNLSLSMFPTND